MDLKSKIIQEFEKKFKSYVIEEGSQNFIFRVESKDGKVAYVVDCIFKIINEAKGKIPYDQKNFWNKAFEVLG